MLDDHSQGSYSVIDQNISLDHSGIFKCESIVDIHITCELELRIPKLDNRDLGMGYTYHSFHPIYSPLEMV